MTRITAERATALGPEAAKRLRTETARFEAFEAPPASFDLVASSMSLHHVKDKAPLYSAVARWLEPGAQFAFADQLAGATEFDNQKHWELWLRFCREPGNCTEEEIASLTEHSRAHDHYVPLVEHFRMMREAGFVNLDLVWRLGMYSVVVADRGRS
jgi:SAM-dependent methyltransferase